MLASGGVIHAPNNSDWHGSLVRSVKYMWRVWSRCSGLDGQVLLVSANVGLHAKVPLIALLALVHLGVALAALVFGGAGRGDERGIHHGASFELQAFGLQQGINRGQNLFGRRSSRWRKRRMLDSLGMCSSQWDWPAKSRKAGTSCSASSIAGSLSLNHCCMKWMRSRVCTAKGCCPLRPLSGA